MPSKSLLLVESLSKTFEPKGLFLRTHAKPFTAVNNVSFDLNMGEVVGLLGPNGSGKTTMMHMLLGTLVPTSGSIKYFDKDFESNRSELLQHIGFASSYLKLAPRLTIEENLDVFGRLYGLTYAQRVERMQRYLKAFDLWDIRSKEVASLSAGQTTRVMLTKAFLTDPQMVLLDEPTASLDPDIAYEIRQFILNEQTQRGIGLLLASHNMDEVSQMCNRVLVLKHGTIIANDTPMALASRISLARINLTILHGMDTATQYAQSHNLSYRINGSTLTIDIDEHKVGQLLIQFAHALVGYTHVAIAKPSLEDYFLQIAHDARTTPKELLV
jgi:ABC-2 type transport system ATP-binding protein